MSVPVVGLSLARLEVHANSDRQRSASPRASAVSDPPRGSRILELDALRGLAALAVVLFHYTTRYEDLFGHSLALPYDFRWGERGVDLFFMLSGFLILMTLERTSNWFKFAWGRFTRLYPAYWAAVGLTFAFVVSCGLPGQEVSLAEAFVNLTMVQALLGVPHVDGSYWSLQAELIFYVNMLLLFRWGAFSSSVKTTLIWVGLAAWMIVGQRYFIPAETVAAGLASKVITLLSLKYIALFSIGMLVYDLHRGPHARWWTCRGHLLALTVCFAAIAIRKGPQVVLIDLLLAAVLAMAVTGRLKVLNARGLVFLGAISYSLYLTHQNIGFLVIRELQKVGVQPLTSVSVAMVVAFAIAVQLHRLVERPALDQLRSIDPLESWGAWRRKFSRASTSTKIG